jgi:hypothetical protein
MQEWHGVRDTGRIRLEKRCKKNPEKADVRKEASAETGTQK